MSAGFFGYQKWFEYEAQALIPYISHGPFIFWMYAAFGTRGATYFLGVSELLLASCCSPASGTRGGEFSELSVPVLRLLPLPQLFRLCQAVGPRLPEDSQLWPKEWHFS